MPSKYNRLEKERPGSVVMQLMGGFYNTFEDGARVLSEVTGYKLGTGKKLKCGFPAGSRNKVEDLFRQQSVNIAFYENGQAVSVIEHGDNNRYADVLSKAQQKTEAKPPVQETDTGKIEKPENNTQHISFIQGIGHSKEDALITIKEELEEKYLKHGKQLTGISLIDAGSQNGISVVQGLAIYEEVR